MRDISDALPLAPITLQILLALAEGESHGYAISKDVALCMRFGSGTLYRQLRQLVKDGWIVETDRRDVDSMGRRYYRLTPLGRRIVRAEIARLESVVRLAHSRKVFGVHQAPSRA